MRSSNPVFSRRGLSRDSGHAGFDAGQQQQAGNPYAAGPAATNQYATNPYANNPYAKQPAAPGQPYAQGARPAAPQTGRMTMDDVVARTGITLGTVILTAAAAWILNVGLAIAIGAALIAMVLAFVQIFKRKPSPPLILGYAAFEGVFLGSISNYVNQWVGDGVAMQAVLGTMAVFAAVLFMYKQRIIRVTKRFYQFVMAAAIGFILLMGVNLLFAVFAGGDGLGFRSGGLGILFGVVGILLGAAFLALDFKQVEDGIAYGAPREESWLAAFGLTLTLVWIYLEFLRLLSILNSD